MNEKEIYYKYLERLRLKFIKKYDELGLRASGEFEQSLESEVKGNRMIMWGAKHSGAMEGGIKASHHPYGPVKAIERWIDVKKGLPSVFYEKKDQMKFAIARKIANEGIKVPNEFNKGNIITDVVNDFLADDIEEMFEEFGKLMEARITSDVIEILKAA